MFAFSKSHSFTAYLGAMLLVAMMALTGCGGDGKDGSPSDSTPKDSNNKDASNKDSSSSTSKTLTLYCGRSKKLVEKVIEKFQAETGIKVEVKYGNTPQLALAIREEGDRSPADVFWAQDAGALGALAKEGKLAALPDDVFANIPAIFSTTDKTWVGTSGRARVIAYAPSRVKKEDLPESVFDLTDEKWKGKVGWAPGNGSFQAFVTAMRAVHGDDKTRQWLKDMKANKAVEYPKNTPILAALAAGEIDLGIPNHYYLLRFKKEDANFPVSQQFFKAGDVGNLVFVAGAGALKTGKNQDAAQKFIRFLLTKESQQYFTDEVNEYPVRSDVQPSSELIDLKGLEGAAPDVDLDVLNDHSGTLELLSDVGLI